MMKQKRRQKSNLFDVFWSMTVTFLNTCETEKPRKPITRTKEKERRKNTKKIL